jgi:hypothetical protein
MTGAPGGKREDVRGDGEDQEEEMLLRGWGGRKGLVAAAVTTAVILPVAAASAQVQEACRATGPVDPVATVARALDVMGAKRADLLHYGAIGTWSMDYQSDRTYPPYFSAFETTDVWYDPATGAQRAGLSMLYPGGGPPPRDMLTDARSTWIVRDGALQEFQALDARARAQRDMNPWAVVRDWSVSDDVRVVGLCPYRDDDRLVLERSVRGRPERLFLDVESGFPVKLDRTVPDGTWGQRHEEVLWSTWMIAGPGAFVPAAAFILHDGEVNRQRTVGAASLAESADPPFPALPKDAVGVPPRNVLGDREAMRPDTHSVGADAFLLSHPQYNSALVCVGDTVWVLDATLNQARAQEDAAWIEKLYPEAHSVVVVVTDLAWPHVGGVRWWVSQGATIMAHRSAEPFLRSLVERRWTLIPDALEEARRKGPVPFDFRPVDDQAAVGGGHLRMLHINGLSSEGALMVYDQTSRFLWAGDWIQDTQAQSLYASEVTAAAARHGIEPMRYAAEHVPVGDWAEILRLNPVVFGDAHGPRAPR